MLYFSNLKIILIFFVKIFCFLCNIFYICSVKQNTKQNKLNQLKRKTMKEILNKKCTKIRANEWQIQSFTLKNSYIIKESYGEYAIYLQNTGSVTKVGILETEQDFNAFLKIFI